MTVDVMRRAASSTGLSIRPRNLLLTLEELAALFHETLSRGDRLNTFLLAAGMSQIAEDHAHRDPLRLAEAGVYLEATGSTRLARAAAVVASGAQALRERRRAAESVAVYRQELRRAVAESAAALVSQRDLDAPELPAVPPELALEVLRMPACFHAFDQQPEDVERLTAEFARCRPDRTRTVLVVGIRTSGSYLAPLCAAFLRRLGYTDVRVLTIRAGRPLATAERREVRACAALKALALVIDDAPGTGRSLLSATRAVERLGVGRESIVVVAPLFRGQELPLRLRRYASVVLPGDEWEIERRLEPHAVAEDLARVFGPRVEHVLPVPLPDRSDRRGHRRALFRIRLAGDAERMVLAEGLGLGYFGEHSLAVGEALGFRVPEIYGLRDGVLYREWLAKEQRRGDAALAPAVAEYVVARNELFPVERDLSVRLAGQTPTWEVVSGILSRGFLRAWPLARLAFLDRAMLLLLRPSRPSVVDGSTFRSHWFGTGRGPSGFSKVGFADHSFWHLGLTCFDPVFDLAGVDPGGFDEGLAREVRHSYEQLSRESVDAERWVLYQLAHLWGRRRTRPEDEAAHSRASARALQRYFGEVLLADIALSADGPLCAIDLDGVLETEALGFPATTAAGALVLRALACHGFRPVIVSGRSSGEVAERCACYRLAGGVAEYGAVAYDSEHTREWVMLADGAARMLGELRAAVSEEVAVEVDVDYEHSVRAYRRAEGRRCGLPEAAIAKAVRQLPVQAIRGEGQTDFVPADVDKGTGLRALAGELGSEIALAVGDTASDLPMFALAERAFAPANADGQVKTSGVQLVRRSYQAGLAEAVGRFLGHAPGTCPVCRPPTISRRTKLLLELLSVQESGPAGVIANLPRLAWKVRTW